jgi:vitamin B12 transporter
MRKKITILTVLTYFFLSVTNAQTGNDTIHLDEVQIKSNRLNISDREVLGFRQKLSVIELNYTIDNDVSTALKNAGSVDIRQRSFSNVQSDLIIRGGNFDQNIILINGINLSDPQTGHHNLNLPIVNSALKGIEIAYGPSSRIYGVNALTGAVNFITRIPDKNFAEISLKFGSFNSVITDFTGGIKTQKSSHLLNLSYSQSDGFENNTDYYRVSAYYENNTRIKSIYIKTMAGIIGKGFGAQSFYTPAFPDQYEEIRSGFAAIKAEGGQKIRWNANVYYRQLRDRFELYREHRNYYVREYNYWINKQKQDTVHWYQNHNFHKTHVVGSGINTEKKWSAGKTTLGADFRTEIIYSNVLGNPLNENRDDVFSNFDKRNNLSFFADHGYYREKLKLNTGVMVYLNKDYGWNYYYGADIGYFFYNKILLKAGINKALRLPSFTDLYYKGPSNEGNSQLIPETAITYETGIKLFNDKNSYLGVNLFYRQGWDIIAWVKEPGDSKWKTENLTELNTYGIEFASFYTDFPQQFPIESIRTSYTFLEQNKSAAGLESKYSIDHLKHKLIVNTEHKIYKNIKGFLSIIYFKRNGQYEFFDNETLSYAELRDYKSVLLINFGLVYQLNRFSLSLKAANLTNNDYFDIANVPTPGISLMGGVKYIIND